MTSRELCRFRHAVSDWVTGGGVLQYLASSASRCAGRAAVERATGWDGVDWPLAISISTAAQAHAA